jgi:hypothetical protein
MSEWAKKFNIMGILKILSADILSISKSSANWHL